MNNQRKSWFLLLIIAMAMATAACNTTKGLGKDVEKVGEEIQEEAEQHD
jgi:predicted small secreted protein